MKGIPEKIVNKLVEDNPNLIYNSRKEYNFTISSLKKPEFIELVTLFFKYHIDSQHIKMYSGEKLN